MEKRKPFGDLTNLSGLFFSSPNEKKDDFTVTKPRKPDQIVAKTDVDSSEKVDQEQQKESPNLGVSSLESFDLEMTEESPVKGKLRTRPADLIISQQVSSLQSLDVEEMEEMELSGWNSPSLHSQDSQTDFFVLRSPQVYSVVSSPLYNLAPSLQLMSPVSPPIAFHPQSVPSLPLSPCLSSHPSQGEALFATLVAPGFVRLCLSHGVSLDISNGLSLRINNPMMESSIAVCGLSQRAAIIHPSGRALIYSPRLEVQVKDEVSIKTAKLFPRGRVSFTADNYSLVYSLDSGGPRSTTDVFHDLLADNIVDTMFHENCLAQHTSMAVSRKQMYESQYWRTPVSLPSYLSSL